MMSSFFVSEHFIVYIYDECFFLNFVLGGVQSVLITEMIRELMREVLDQALKSLKLD
jgi:hypothetical protein